MVVLILLLGVDDVDLWVADDVDSWVADDETLVVFVVVYEEDHLLLRVLDRPMFPIVHTVVVVVVVVFYYYCSAAACVVICNYYYY
jgi:hypothetical protein